MKKINVIIQDKNTLVLQEDASKGDYIDLNDIESVDLNHINNVLLKEKEASYQKQINDKMNLTLEKIKKDYEISLINETNKYNEKINELALEIKKLKENNSHEITELLSKKNHEIELLKIESKNEKDKLEAKLKEKDNLKDLEIANNIQEIKQKYNEEILLLKSKLEKLANESLLKIQTKENDHIKEVNELKENYENYNKALQFEIERLKLVKSTLNVKMLGEELENWCNEEYESYATIGFNNCSWEKDNTVIKDEDEAKGTKADYIFRSYLDSNKTLELASVCCEMKNEALTSKNKKKNSDHYQKLDKDRIKKNCEYALLISELEWDSANDTPIKKVRDYDKMYVVRPQYFITFLSLISSLANKYSEVLLEKKKDELTLLSSIEILEEFEGFKKTYLENPLDSLIKKIEKIQKNSEAIATANKTIIETCNEIMFTTISNMKDKIERFNIKKIANKVKKIEN